jgi:hypothetical protein
MAEVDGPWYCQEDRLDLVMRRTKCQGLKMSRQVIASQALSLQAAFASTFLSRLLPKCHVRLVKPFSSSVPNLIKATHGSHLGHVLPPCQLSA